MKTIHLELSPEMAKQMLPALERQQNLLQDQADKIGEQIKAIQRELRPSNNGHAELFSPKVTPPSQTKGGRAKKGETEKVVLEYLRQVNGQGTSLSAISKNTGAKYSSVRRILQVFLTKETVTEKDGLWFINE
jgi:hypothetical protein